MSTQNSAEVVVVGGGVVGTAVAAFLARDGVDVILVERGEFAWGSSRRCDGHVATYDSPPGYFSRFCQRGLELFSEIAPKLPCDIGFEPEGIGLLVDDERDLEVVMRTYEGKKAEGSNVVFWDRDELRRHEPNIADGILACLNFMGDAKLNPMHLAFGLAESAKNHGARMLTRTAVTGFRLTDGRIAAVETDAGPIATKKVVLSAGVWTPVLGSLLGLRIPIRPRQGQIFVTERLSGLATKNYAEYGYLLAKGGRKRTGVTPAMEQFGVAMVLEPSGPGTVLFGSSRRYVGLNMEPDPEVLQAMAQRAMRFFPAVADARIIRAYAGVRPASLDGKPIISPTHLGGVYVAAGHEGNGIGLSLITGQLMSQLIRGEKPEMDITPLNIDRFGLNPKAAAAA